jgi:NAD(P)-dependent dehydrogenase (short-subunit alcohol dehydrogenase family)
MTGGTSGFGQRAAKLLASSHRLILATRYSPAIDGATAIPADLLRLDSVRAFAEAVVAEAGEQQIDALVLNAGGSFPDGRSADGFEINFAVNHLAHYLLLRLLAPKLAIGATLVLTTSGTHDPAEKTMIPPPLHADALKLAYPDRDPQRERSSRKAAGRAYSASKLCNLLTAHAFAASSASRQRGIRVIAYSPGPTPGTGLMRSLGPVLNFAWLRLGPALRWAMPSLNSVEDAGNALAGLTLGRFAPPAGRIYALLKRGKLTYPDPSELARRDDVMLKLWDDSAKLVGLDPEPLEPR